MNKNELKSVEIYTAHIELIRGMFANQPEKSAHLINAVIDFQLYGVEPEDLEQDELLIWNSIVYSYDAKMKRRLAASKNGKKGGAPKGNTNAKKKTAVLSQDNAEVGQVTIEPTKVSQNEKKGPQNEELTTGYLPAVKPNQINKDLLKEIIGFTMDEHGRVKDTEEINNGWITNHERLIKKYGITNDYLCRCIYAVSQK